jgi:hypothetical protein
MELGPISRFDILEDKESGRARTQKSRNTRGVQPKALGHNPGSRERKGITKKGVNAKLGVGS